MAIKEIANMVPHEFSRKPRPLKKHRADYKGTMSLKNLKIYVTI